MENSHSADNFPSSDVVSKTSALNPQSPYAELPDPPTLEAADGIRFDYCDGLRVKFPKLGDGRLGIERGMNVNQPDAVPYQASMKDGVPFNGPWRLRVEEAESGLIVFDALCRAGDFKATRKKWFCPYVFTIWRDGEAEPCFRHSFNATGKDVLIQMAVGTLGDSIAWLGAALRFGAAHQCKLTVSVNPAIRDLFASSHPDVRFVTKEEAAALCAYGSPYVNGNTANAPREIRKKDDKMNVENVESSASPSRRTGARKDGDNTAPSFYAAYRLGLFFNDDENDHEPSDFRLTGLHHAASHILGLPESEEPPFLNLAPPLRPTEDGNSARPPKECFRPSETIALLSEKADGPCPSDLNGPVTSNGRLPIEEPYVCIATKASMQCKFWNHPTGWVRVIEFLKKSGYRVLCIDRERDGGGVVPNPMPRGCEDFTGNFPLVERARLLQGAAFFIGLPSGLSWLAWACKIPVVLISGFSLPNTEFKTPRRVLSPHACHGCWNDRRFPFDHHDFMWCPKHKGTERQFECTRLITPEQVIAEIKKLEIRS